MAQKWRRQHGLGSNKTSNQRSINYYPSFFVALVSSSFVVGVVIVLLSVDVIVYVAATSTGRHGFPPSIAPRRNIASCSLHGHPLSFLKFLLSSLSESKNDADDGDDDEALLSFYYTKPPHDRRLYEIIGVQTNSTLYEIKKAWRRLSREYHPDKVLPTIAAAAAVRRKRTSEINNMNNSSDLPQAVNEDDAENQQETEEKIARRKLSEIAHAYEILSDDRTRLLYHRFGLVGGRSDAIIRLLSHAEDSATTPTHHFTSNDEEARHWYSRLMELMGHSGATHALTFCSTPLVYRQPHDQHHHHHQRRIDYLTATITERLRPIIEGTTSQEIFIDAICRECNSLKYAPLGAQILRCIGRAYQAEGRRALRRKRIRGRTMVSSPSLCNHHRHYRRHHYHFPQNSFYSGMSEREMSIKKKNGHAHQHEVVVDAAIDTWCAGKQYALAALASGRVVMMERKVKKMEVEINSFDRELNHNKKKKLHEALLSAHQLEALWKISKIELYRTVRQACRRIVEEPHHTTFTASTGIIGAGYDARHRRRDDQEGHGGWYACFPSWGGHQQSPFIDDVWQHEVPPPPPPPPSRGEHHSIRHTKGNAFHWNVHDGMSIYSGEVGRLRAAAAMVLVGDTMVQCSKDETA